MKRFLIAAAIAAAPVTIHAQDVEQLPPQSTTTTTTTTNGTIVQDVQTVPTPQAAAPDQSVATTTDGDRTISWYIAHTPERKARIQVCDNDPGHLENDPDCINAKKADNQAGVNDFKQGVDNTVQGAADFFHKF